ncbi:MAG: hypothetical protein IJ832_05435 [Bacteroidaceae bacterium]|nr:hypothetical protein [Bacteroidaceae bacterium]
MRKKITYLALAIVLPLAMTARDWTSYISYHDVTKTLPLSNKVYAIGSGGLFSYVFGDDKVSTYSKSTGLSSTNIIHMAYCEELEELLLVYSDYNIDILDINDSIINIPEFKNSSFPDKTINAINIMGEEAFLATNAGIVVINLRKAEYTNAYETNFRVRDALGDDDNIYALGPDGIYAGDRSKNLLDRSNWSRKTCTYMHRLIPFNDKIYVLNTSRGFFSLDTQTFKTTSLAEAPLSHCSTYGEELVLTSPTQVIVMDKDEQIQAFDFNNDFADLASDGTHLWAARGSLGLQAFSIDTDSLGDKALVAASGSIVPNSPIRNYFDYIKFTDNNRLLVAGGALNYSGQTLYEGTLMMFGDGIWTNFNEDSIAIKTGASYSNMTSLVQDPNDPSHHYASSATSGLYEYCNGQFVELYNNDNTPITCIYPNRSNYKNFNRICGAAYDPKGNLWMFNNQVDTIIRVMTPDKKWESFYYDALKGSPTFDHYLFDDRGWVWMSHRRWAGTFQAGIACLNYNNTLSVKSDDNFNFCTTFTDQNGTTTQLSQLYHFAFDRNGQLWIATDQGIFILEDPTTIFNTRQTFHRPLIPRNDGTNYADYLLSGVPVKCIAVDGANRKWLGTTNNGLYLVSEDGLEIIEHFTTDNSPLLSNCILSLAIRPDNGLLMIGTDQGLMSYRADATEPADELKESNIKVFPNPVRPNYEGKIRITGFTADSDIKITSPSGLLVAQGTSLGGTFVWDGRNKAGDRVATGVYLVVASDADGKNGVVAKILMVK